MRLGLARWLRAASVDQVVPKRAAMDAEGVAGDDAVACRPSGPLPVAVASRGGGRVAGGAAVEPLSRRTCPAKMRLGLARWLRAARADQVVPKRAAMEPEGVAGA